MTIRQSNDVWNVDFTEAYGMQMTYTFSHEGEEYRGRSVCADDWVDSFGEPSCESCKYELRVQDKRYLGYWVWKLICPCCDTELFLKEFDSSGESLESIQQEYVESFMSEQSLEASLETVIQDV